MSSAKPTSWRSSDWWVAAEHPALRGMLPSAVLAVNHRAVGPGHVVRETDELAIIGLVGGG